jgi:hypothetical protein
MLSLAQKRVIAVLVCIVVGIAWIDSEIAPEVTGHGLPLSKCEAYKRVYDQPYGSS